MTETAKLLFIGQAYPKNMGKYEFDGSKFYSWFNKIGISTEFLRSNSHITAVLPVYSGTNPKGTGDRLPNQQEIDENLPRLKELILRLNPKVIIPIGKFSIETIFGVNKINLENYISKEFDINPYQILDKTYKIIPLPHPSGLSRWIYQKNHAQLLDRALQMISEYLSS